MSSSAIAETGPITPPVLSSHALAASHHGCRNTRVKTVGTRLQEGNQDIPGTGYDVLFSGTWDDPFKGQAKLQIVTYQADPANDFIGTSRPGDRVQVCLVSVPTKTNYCDPVKDGRGRIFRIYDFKHRYSYVAQNSEHGCGGA